MQNDLISIIVPVYNTKEYLTRCVNSLTAQTYPNLEILLVDDGSDDGSGELCGQLAAADPRIRVFHKLNGGSSSARNLGISKAGGKYVGFVDSDDYVEPDMYERLLKALQENNALIAQIGRNEIDPSGQERPDICTPPETLMRISPKEFMEELLMHRGDCSFCTKLVSRQFFFYGEPAAAKDYNSFPVGVLNEDFHLLVQLLSRSGPVLSLPGVGYHVVYRVGSNSRKKDKNDFSRVYADNIDNADMVASIVARDYPELTDIAFRFGVFQRLDYMLHIPIGQMKKSNFFYIRVVTYLRKSWAAAMKNKILTKKNKIYHTLFAAAPRTVRVIHRFTMRLRGKE